MARITIQKDITKRSQDEHLNVPEQINLLGWMIERYVTPPECGLVVWLNGDIIANSDEQAPEEFDDAIDFEVGEIDHVIIQHRPHAVNPATIKLIAVALVASAATILLAPKPSIPNNAGEQSSSPNNQLTAATNEFRPRQAIPDIAGRIRAYPDFVQPSYYEYVDNQRVFRELFVIGRGYHSIHGVESEKTPILPRQYDIYQPGEIIPAQKIVRGTNDVDGLELIPPEDSDDSINIDGSTVTTSTRIRFANAVDLQVGDTVIIDVSYNNGASSIFGEYTVTNIGSFFADFDGNFDTSNDPDNVIGTITNVSPRLDNWYILNGQATEIWIQATMPQGIRGAAGGPITVFINVTYQKVDSNGNPFGGQTEELFAFSGSSIDPQGDTFKILGLDLSLYRVKIERNTPMQPEGGRDTLIIEDIQSVRDYQPDFGELTSIFMQRQAARNGTVQRQSKISVDAEREIPIFNPSTGTFGARATTRSAAQYIIYLLSTLGGVPLEQIDYEGLFEEVPADELGFFDFSFDDKDVSLRERVITAANAARIRVYYVGATWNFVREEPRPNRVALFSRRNIAPNSSSQTFRFHRDGDPDGVTIKWVDPDTNAEAYEYRRWDGSQVLNEQALRPIEESLAGCRNQAQAANRADWEMNKLINQRRRVTDTVIKDALYVGLGERVGWVDINDADLFDGEIMGISGSDYDTSERFTPEPDVDYYVYITDDEGNTSATVQAYPRADTEFGFSAPGLSGAYVATGIQQLGSRYFIASQNELDAADFIVVSKGRPDEQGRVQVELAEVIEE